MRTISKNPIDVIPDLTEHDLEKSIIIATISTDIAILIKKQYGNNIVLNWYGGKRNDCLTEGYPWNWEIESSLISFIAECWAAWRHFNDVKMYICENMLDVYLIINANITNDGMKSEFVSIASKVFK